MRAMILRLISDLRGNMVSPEDANKRDTSQTTDAGQTTDASKTADASKTGDTSKTGDAGETTDSGKPKEIREEPPSPQPEAAHDDRRAQERTETILSEIEDATYKVLRKHQDKKTE
jgi:hypothetical protein